MALLAALWAVASLATSAIAKGSSIGEEKAENFAFADLGIDPLSAQNVHTEFGFEQGQFVYEVTFVADGTEYEYWVKAADGTVVKKEMDLIAERGNQPSQPSQQSQSGQPGQQSQSSQDPGAIRTEGEKDNSPQPGQPSQDTGRIDLDKAKELALSDAGLSQAEVTFTKTELDEDGRIALYEVEFYTSSYEYEYEVDASTGEIRSRAKERFENKSGSIPEAPESSNANTGVEQAKSIAASHAGFSASDVTFSKVKLEEEDGQAVYEIKFYKDGIEYEYEISAASGEVLKFESEQDD